MGKAEEKAAFAIELAESVVRRWWTIVAGLCVGVAAALIALHHMPKVYESSTKILVSRPQISESLVPTTVVDDMRQRMATLQEAVLSRPYVEKIIEEFYPPKPEGEALERMVEEIRWKVTVEVRRGYFSVTFRDQNAVRAARVANALAQFYIDENAQFRIGRAGDTTETLQQLADAALEKLTEKENAIRDFKAKYPHETNTDSFHNVQMREFKQRDLEQNEANVKFERQALESLREQLARARTAPQVPLAEEVSDDPAAQQLAALRRDLAELKNSYTETHPAVVAKQREVDQLAGEIAARTPLSADGTPAVSATVARLEQKIADSEATIARLSGESSRIRAEIARVDQLIERTPQIRQQLDELTKGYEQIRSRYNDYQTKVESAKGSEMIEEGRKSEQFEVMEAAQASNIPVEPIPLFVFGGNIAWALLVFVGPVLIRRVLKPTIGSQKSVKALSDVPLLVAIPPLETAAVVSARHRLRMSNIVCSGLALLLVAGVSFFLFQ